MPYKGESAQYCPTYINTPRVRREAAFTKCIRNRPTQLARERKHMYMWSITSAYMPKATQCRLVWQKVPVDTSVARKIQLIKFFYGFDKWWKTSRLTQHSLISSVSREARKKLPLRALHCSCGQGCHVSVVFLVRLVRWTLVQQFRHTLLLGFFSHDLIHSVNAAANVSASVTRGRSVRLVWHEA